MGLGDNLGLHLVDLAETLVAADGAVADLPATDLTAVARYRGARRRAQASASRLLTRAALGRELATAPGEVPVTVDGWGRPAVHCGRGLDLNVSHDQGMVVLVVGGATCGVDIADTEEDDLREVVVRFCAEDEKPASARQWWAAKESAAKAIGRGLRAGLSSIRFDGDPGVGWAPVTWRGDRLPLRTRTVDLGARHLAVTATFSAAAPTVAVRAWRPVRAHGRWWLAEPERTPASLAVAAGTLTSELSQGRG